MLAAGTEGYGYRIAGGIQVGLPKKCVSETRLGRSPMVIMKWADPQIFEVPNLHRGTIWGNESVRIKRIAIKTVS